MLLSTYLTLYSGKNSWKESDFSDFTDSDFWHYIQLKHTGQIPKRSEAKFDGFSERHFQGNKISGSVEKFHLQPLAQGALVIGLSNTRSARQEARDGCLGGCLIITSFIIVIAWVNYINLSTARSVERAKEVGVRKSLGRRGCSSCDSF